MLGGLDGPKLGLDRMSRKCHPPCVNVKALRILQPVGKLRHSAKDERRLVVPQREAKYAQSGIAGPGTAKARP